MPKNGKSAVFVLCALLAAFIVAITTALTSLRETAADAVSTLVETALLTAVMVVASGWTAYRLWRLEKDRHLAMNAGMLIAPIPRPWRWMSRRQWTTLTLGLTVIVTLTSAVAGIRVMRDPTTPEPVSVIGPPADTTPPAIAPGPTDTTQPSPTDTVTPDGMDTTTEDPTTEDPTTADPPTDDPSTDGPLPPAVEYLDQVDTVNGGYHFSGPVYFSGQRYPRSVTLECDSASEAFVWKVAGYRTFTATLGVDDSTSHALGGIAEMIFYDQDGHQLAKPVDVSLAHRRDVKLDITGVVQLRITCAARDAKTNEGRDFLAALGNAEILQ